MLSLQCKSKPHVYSDTTILISLASETHVFHHN